MTKDRWDDMLSRLMLLSDGNLLSICITEEISVREGSGKREIAKEIVRSRREKAEKTEAAAKNGELTHWRQFNSIRSMKYREKAGAFK